MILGDFKKMNKYGYIYIHTYIYIGSNPQSLRFHKCLTIVWVSTLASRTKVEPTEQTGSQCSQLGWETRLPRAGVKVQG